MVDAVLVLVVLSNQRLYVVHYVHVYKCIYIFVFCICYLSTTRTADILETHHFCLGLTIFFTNNNKELLGPIKFLLYKYTVSYI